MSQIADNFKRQRGAVEADLQESVSISGLCGPLRIFQRLNGHRHSIDDAITSWYALTKYSNAERVLDLGSGIGSVGLAVLWGLSQSAHLTCVEAQSVSYKLLKANIECNGLASRVRAFHGDLREAEFEGKFQLITGSPPYFPANAGIIPKDSQKAHARFELRGHVGDYARVARKYLEDNGVFVFCFPYQQKSRAFRLVEQQDFKIAAVKDVIPNSRSAPLFSVYSAVLNKDAVFTEEDPLIVEAEDGRYSEDMLVVQRARGFGNLGENNI